MDLNNLQELNRKYFIYDWICGIVLFLLDRIMETFVYPHCRYFSWNDESINHPMAAQSTFPSWSLLLMLFLALGIYVGVVKLLDKKGPMLPWVRAQMWAAILSNFSVNCVKLYAGRLRPDYLSRLRKFGYNEQTWPTVEASLEFYCPLMHKDGILRDGRMSFPSGHSSSAFSVCVMLSLFLWAHLRPASKRGSFWRLLVCLSPLIVAVMCAVSRTRDNRHHFSDILAGSLIGTVFPILCFIVVFRPLDSSNAVYTARLRGSPEDEFSNEQGDQAGGVSNFEVMTWL